MTPLNFDPINNAYAPSLALTTNGTPIVAWHEADDYTHKAYVKCWNGAAWDLVGGGALNVASVGSAYAPSLRVFGDNPTVAWVEHGATTNSIYVKRWNGSSWLQVGFDSLNIDPSNKAYTPSLALDRSGNPTVAWHEQDGVSENV